MNLKNGVSNPWLSALEEAVSAFLIVFFMALGAFGWPWPPPPQILFAATGSSVIWAVKTWNESRGLRVIIPPETTPAMIRSTRPREDPSWRP